MRSIPVYTPEQVDRAIAAIPRTAEYALEPHGSPVYYTGQWIEQVAGVTAYLCNPWNWL